jgi:integrase
MRLAEIARAKRAQQVFAGEWDLVDAIAAGQTLYAYTGKLWKRKNADPLLKRLLGFLEKYPGGTAVRISEIKEKWVEEFQRYLLENKDVSASSSANYSRAIRVVLNSAVKDKIIVQSPAKNVKGIPQPETDRVFLSLEEVRRLANTPPGRGIGEEARRAFLFACFTGLRVSDLRTLAWGDVEHSPPRISKKQEKTGSRVYIPLHESAWKIINDGAIHDYREPVFPGIAPSGRDHCRVLKSWAKRAGIRKNIGWHTARHTFAVLSLEAGAEIYTVSKLLGHRSLKTTQIYAKVTDKLKRAAVEALPAVEIKG